MNRAESYLLRVPPRLNMVVGDGLMEIEERREGEDHTIESYRESCVCHDN